MLLTCVQIVMFDALKKKNCNWIWVYLSFMVTSRRVFEIDWTLKILQQLLCRKNISSIARTHEHKFLVEFVMRWSVFAQVATSHWFIPIINIGQVFKKTSCKNTLNILCSTLPALCSGWILTTTPNTDILFN